jgi:hypothetical protein
VTVLVVGLTVAVALLGVLVLGLLRSHAEILRQLHALGAGREDTAPGSSGTATVDPAGGAAAEQPFDVTDGVVRPAGVTGTVAQDVSGMTPDDEAALVSVAGVEHDTLIAFLSSGCSTCQGFWDVFADPTGTGLPDGVRLVVVTQGAGLESESAVRSVAPPGLPVVMSTEAWEQYGVPGSPYFVLVEGRAGRVAGAGSAKAWQQVVRLVAEATADRAIAVRRHREDRGDGAHREARADRELAAAGISPGHASLYVTADELTDDTGAER